MQHLTVFLALDNSDRPFPLKERQAAFQAEVDSLTAMVERFGGAVLQWSYLARTLEVKIPEDLAHKLKTLPGFARMGSSRRELVLE